MLRRCRDFVWAVAAFVLLTCAPPAAFAALDVSPFVGWYLPTNSIQKDALPSLYLLEAESAPAFGARLTWSTSSRLGFEASVAGAFGNHSLLSLQAASRTIFADARVRFRLTAPDSPTAVFLTGGAGLVSMSNSLVGLVPDDAFAFKSVPSGVVGLGVALPVNDHWSMRLDLEDHIYNADVEADESFIFRDGARMQNDLMITLGLVLPIGSR